MEINIVKTNPISIGNPADIIATTFIQGVGGEDVLPWLTLPSPKRPPSSTRAAQGVSIAAKSGAG